MLDEVAIVAKREEKQPISKFRVCGGPFALAGDAKRAVAVSFGVARLDFMWASLDLTGYSAWLAANHNTLGPGVNIRSPWAAV